MAVNTKSILAATLKDLMKNKSLGRISVKMITDECSLNRQTFYYHFPDKYCLVNWIFDRDIIDKVKKDFTYDSWDKALELTFRLIEEESWFYLNALHDNFCCFHIHLLETQHSIINSIMEELLAGHEIDKKDREFFADFYTNAFVGTFINWINSNMHEPADMVIARLKKIVRGSLQNSIKDYIK